MLHKIIVNIYFERKLSTKKCIFETVLKYSGVNISKWIIIHLDMRI